MEAAKEKKKNNQTLQSKKQGCLFRQVKQHGFEYWPLFQY